MEFKPRDQTGPTLKTFSVILLQVLLASTALPAEPVGKVVSLEGVVVVFMDGAKKAQRYEVKVKV